MSDVNLGMHILEVEITTRCNLNCKHCYNRRFDAVDFPIEKLFELYDFANQHKIWTFILSGGEPIMHPEFDLISKKLSKRPDGCRSILQSNGTLLNEGMIDKLRNFNLIHLSCDYGNYVRANALKNFGVANMLKDNGLDCYLFVTIHKKNIENIDDLVLKANQAGVDIGFNICIPVENQQHELLLSPEDFMQAERKLYNLAQEGKILRYSSPLVSLFDDQKKGTYSGIKGGCSAGVGACLVAADGEVFPCPFFRVSAGNIYGNSLQYIWDNSDLFKKLRNRLAFNDPCGSCERLGHCGGCRKRAYFKCKNIGDADPMCYRDSV